MAAPFTTAFIPGLSLGLSLIIAIGAQNAFVLRQGLRKEHVFAVCLVCATSDALLIAAGVAGFGQIIAKLPWLEPLMRYGGAAFLLIYAIRAFISAARHNAGLSPLDGPVSSFKKTLLTVIGFTWLNPHVYLDTVVLLGSVSTQYRGHKVAFALGAMSGSVLFFFSLGYGAHYLRPLFASPISWRVLDIIIGCIMTSVALSLIL
ncbi:MAG: LysE/ArgO family amino acid transporter [Acidocella sp.]|nr:LysE/ArgO family amino acid transporter [Acidocella sp.]